MIRYTDEKTFTQEQVVALFESVGWDSANYPSRLHKALCNSSTVITAWDGDELVGLIRAIDDGELLAYIKYVLVKPSHHRQGIAGELVRLLKEKYVDYLYVDIMPEESANAPFYEKRGFTRMPDGVPLEIANFDEALRY